MKKTTSNQTILVAALVLGLASSASAQSMQTTTPAESGMVPSLSSGLVGTNYTELGFGYLKQAAVPHIYHDYEFLMNQAVERSGTFGVDANFTYDYLTGGSQGGHDYRNTGLLGATAYLNEDWGKPFVTADGGWAVQQSAGIVGESFAYKFVGGVEFATTARLSLTPFVQYEAEPRLTQDRRPLANMANYVFNYGVTATYRLTREWSASVTAEQDQHSGSTFGLLAGMSYHY
jgi:hypothetical protein